MKRVKPKFKSTKPSRTQQSFKEEADVNSIMERYRRTGMITNLRTTQGTYGDFSTFQDFRSQLDYVINAQEQFLELPAHIRKRFGNDPANLIEFLQDEKNRPDAEKLGLVNKRAAETALKNDDKTTKQEPPTQQPPQS